ncbi:MAG: hypothetical protein DHS20C20_28330 [Ardenticatenaceae bacterium]|nr:MAG: hypothetical protein DHS20C20_28330 [Ardenticatenaceae bacterium]
MMWLFGISRYIELQGSRFGKETYLTKRKPDLRRQDRLPLSYAVFEGVLPVEPLGFSREQVT